MIDVCLLGTGGTVPLPSRFLTSLILAFEGRMLLIDCGEGTQVSLKLLKWGLKNIDTICFTHYHADHIAGLPGLLLTIGNSGKTEPLTLIGPEGLEKIVRGLTVISPNLPYELKFIELKDGLKQELEFQNHSVTSIPVDHTIPCVSYSITLRRKRKFDRLKAEENHIPMLLWNRLQKGESIEHQGRLIVPEMVLGEERRGIKISYCTDTRPIDSIIKLAEDSDLFICEGMYGEYEKLPKAEENKHMLFTEAAEIAREAKVKELWLTHFSPSLNEPGLYLKNSKNIFENTLIGEDRMIKHISFE